MHLTRIARAALPAAAVLATCAFAPGTADAAKRSDWRYDVTVRAQMTEEWTFHEEAHMGEDVDPCHRYRDAAGRAKIVLKTKRPHRVLVLRGTGGRPPMLDVGTGEGAPLTGSYLRDGKDEEHHEGECAAANPPNHQPTTGCGLQSFKADWSLAFEGKRTLLPTTLLDDLREDCPSAVPNNLEWENDEVPSLRAATTLAAPAKFYGTKQFTVRGQKTFKGLVPTINEPHFQRRGQHEVAWEWEATYRLVSSKKKKRRR